MKKQTLFGLVMVIIILILSSCTNDVQEETVLDQLAAENSWQMLQHPSQLYFFEQDGETLTQVSTHIGGECYVLMDISAYERMSTVTSSPSMLEITFTDVATGELMYTRQYFLRGEKMIAKVIVHVENDAEYENILVPTDVKFSELVICS